MTQKKIIRNSLKCKNCGEHIESKHRHDYVLCKCGSCAVDGGKEYLRRAGVIENMEETSIVEEDKK